MTKYTWARYGGYECSTRGDPRFSAFNARLPDEDNRSIEEIYQCDVKGYAPGSRNWRLGKGKPPLRPRDTWPEYLDLWRRWANQFPFLLQELRLHADHHDGVLSDRFASTPINQARALATLLNERYAQ